MNDALKNDKIGPLLLKLAIPSICAQLVTLLYNMVDRMYIGHMSNGTLAIAGVGLCSSLITIIAAFTNLFGRGGSPLASISLGSGDHERANKITSNVFISLICTSIILTIIIFVWGKPLLYLFGASDQTIAYALDYLRIYNIGIIFVQLSVGMNYFINCQGYSKFGMMTLVIGSVINIILDPIFIFTFNMGVSGAALATVISQAVSAVWVMQFIFSKRSNLRIKKEYLMFDQGIMKEVFGLGISPFFMRSTEGILQISFNRQLLFYGGDIAVSSMTILFSVAQIINLPMEGIAQGSQPIISFNYGAKDYKRVKDTINICLKATLAFSLIVTSIVLITPQTFIKLFTSDTTLISASITNLRVYLFGFLTIGSFGVHQQSYTALGNGKQSFIFAFLRKIVLLIPLMYIIPYFTGLGVIGVLLAEPISDIIVTILNAVYFRRFLSKKLS